MKNLTSLITAALFSALIAVGAFIKLPLPYPVPITLQTLFLFLSAFFLRPCYAAFSVLLYLIIGLIGLPVFTSGGGPSYIFNPSFGFLISFLPACTVLSLLSRRLPGDRLPKYLLLLAVTLLILYPLGTGYLYFAMNTFTLTPISFMDALVSGCLLFLPLDILKFILAALLAKRMRPVLSRYLS